MKTLKTSKTNKAQMVKTINKLDNGIDGLKEVRAEAILKNQVEMVEKLSQDISEMQEERDTIALNLYEMYEVSM